MRKWCGSGEVTPLELALLCSGFSSHACLPAPLVRTIPSYQFLHQCMKREKKLKVPFIFQMFTSSKKYLSRFLGLLWKEVKGLVEIIHSFIPQLKSLQAVTVRVLITAWIPPGQRFCLNSVGIPRVQFSALKGWRPPVPT